MCCLPANYKKRVCLFGTAQGCLSPDLAACCSTVLYLKNLACDLHGKVIIQGTQNIFQGYFEPFLKCDIHMQYVCLMYIVFLSRKLFDNIKLV